MSESSHVPSLLISPTHDGMLGNWRSHGFILHIAEIGFEPMTFWAWARRATSCATLRWSGQAVRTANPQLWPAPSLNRPGRRLPFRRLSFLPYRTPRRLITTLCFEGNLGEFFTIYFRWWIFAPIHYEIIFFGWVISKLTWQEWNQF